MPYPITLTPTQRNDLFCNYRQTHPTHRMNISSTPKLLALTAALGIAAASSCTAGLIHFSFPGGAVAPSFVDPNAIGGSLLDGPGAGLLGAGVIVSDAACFLPGSTSVSAPSAVANNDYIEFTLSAGPGLGLSLGSFTFDAARTLAAGTAGFVLRSSRDSFSTDIASLAVAAVRPSSSSFNFDLSAPKFQNIAGPTTFRLYGYATGGVGSGICFDDISVNGAVVHLLSSVPEPGTMLFGLALFGTAGLRQRTARRVVRTKVLP